jgi:1,4-dihydroxy-2-naphthoate octaprenyltransferase
MLKIQILLNILKLGRFHFLAGGFLLYYLGVLLALLNGTSLNLEKFIFGYAIMAPAHLALSYSNNYFDINVDRYNKQTLISGGSKILLKNPELKTFCIWFAIILMGISIILSIFFVFHYSFSYNLILFVLFGNFLSWFYSAPPLKLAYRGLGEISNMITMAVLMLGLGYWIINGTFDLLFFIFSIPFLLYGFNFILTVEAPDIKGDKKAGKNNLITRIGWIKSFQLISILSIIASIYFLILSFLSYYYKIINFFIITILSLIPYFAAFLGYYYRPITSNIAIKLSKINMASITIFILTLNLYFILILNF